MILSTNYNNLISKLNEIKNGCLVVHEDHGIGRCSDLITLEIRGIKSDYLVINYADNDKLYLPVSSLNLINKYVSYNEKNVILNKLGQSSWKKIKRKTFTQVNDIAAELLNLYTYRTTKIGFSFYNNKSKYKLFSEEFPYKLTEDQLNAINDVINDMCKPSVMDRLICGDAGFGKTEVAMRAAFVAINNHKQVAVLVPNTLLAEQHLINFNKRFANWSVSIKMISRFLNSKDQKKIIKETSEGKIDILIGTHKILQDSIKWNNLGLLIIDEEHKFGVKHKEHIKKIHSNIDILTLTATPIPRTLNMAMNGILNLSIISTPPEDRLFVKIFVVKYDLVLIRNVILKEISRKGQVYYICNNIKNINKTIDCLKKLVPEASIDTSHSKLHEYELSRVMHNFYHKRINLLVCTTIIETGIDISNANTIIIERADKFGLSQLYQLCGRIGRSNHQAYAYLLTPPIESLNKNSIKRLEVISSFNKLGIGFTVATHDLEIRGAGKLLGKEQSGQIEKIGFILYTNFLKKALNNLKEGKSSSFEELNSQYVEVDLNISTILPDSYITDMNTRLSIYKRIADIKNNQEIEKLKLELITRFGNLPDTVNFLLMKTYIKQKALFLGIKRINCNDKEGFIDFNKENRVNKDCLINLILSNSDIYKIESNNRLKFKTNLIDYNKRLNFILLLLNTLKGI